MTTSRAAIVVCLATLAQAAAAQQSGAANPLPIPNEERSRSETHATSSPDIYNRLGLWKEKASQEQARKEEAQAELERLRKQFAAGQRVPSAPGLGAPAAVTPPAGLPSAPGLTATPASTVGAGVTPGAPPARATTHRRRASKRHFVGGAAVGTQSAETWNLGVVPMPTLLAVSEAEVEGHDTAVPLGSYVKARVLTGVEANAKEPYPVLLQLDYAFVGPNKTKIDLSNCFVIAKAKANLSTERVMGETQDMSCVRSNGEVVARHARGYLAGEDSTFGVSGELISNQGRVIMAAVIAQLAKGAGEAIAAAQTSTQVVSGGVGGGPVQGTNVTGSKAAYVAGRAAAEPAAMVAEWYLDHARQLIPSIAVGSGRDVWIVLLDTVRVPSLAADADL